MTTEGNFSNKRGRGGSSGRRGGYSEKRDPNQQYDNSFIVQQFKIFGEQLDDVNDRRERLVKLSRDLTIVVND